MILHTHFVVYQIYPGRNQGQTQSQHFKSKSFTSVVATFKTGFVSDTKSKLLAGFN